MTALYVIKTGMPTQPGKKGGGKKGGCGGCR